MLVTKRKGKVLETVATQENTENGKENNEETVNFLKKNNYFGYDENNVIIFMQSELPLIDEEGKLLISKDHKIKEASDGNGGTYSSLRVSGCLADMKEKGIEIYMEAAKYITKKYKNTEFHVLGSCEKEYEERMN